MIKKILEDEEIDEKMTKSLDPLDYTGLLKIASEFSDAVIRPKDELSKKVEKALSEISPKKKLHTIINDEKSVVIAFGWLMRKRMTAGTNSVDLIFSCSMSSKINPGSISAMIMFLQPNMYPQIPQFVPAT